MSEIPELTIGLILASQTAPPTSCSHPSSCSRNWPPSCPHHTSLLADYYRSLRLWHFDFPIASSLSDRTTSPLAIDCQSIDLRVSSADFEGVFIDALEP